VTVYDSCFLAVAIESDALLVTADEAFLRKVGAHLNITSLRNLRLPD
jgi:predicted nucleic acid-binding protein